MIASSITVPLITTNELNGIIYELKNKYKIDPINDNYIIPSAVNDKQGTRTTIVTWSSYIYRAAGSNGDKNDAWVQLTFPRGYIFPTAYSMRGVYSTKSSPCFAKSWDVYGIFDGDLNDESKWDLLGQNDTSQSIYCQYLLENRCHDKRVGTFTLKPLPSIIGYKHLRWRARENCKSSCKYSFATSGIDIYGKLSAFSGMDRNVVSLRIFPKALIIIAILLSNLLMIKESF